MPWYRAGTVAVTLNSNAVIGSNTAFMANCRVGDAFIGPDGAQYEVTNIASNTALSITPNYRSASTGAGAYALMPVQGYTKDLADQARTMIQQWGSTLAGLGAVSTENVVPVTKGGTGATAAAQARVNLGLGNAATAKVGIETGNVMQVGAFGLGGASRYVITNPDSSSVGSGFNYYDDQSGGSSQANGRFSIKYSFGAGLNQGFELMAQPWSPKLYFRYSSSSAGAPWYAPLEIYHTGNTTRGSGGALSAASPIVRIASVPSSERRDLQEQTFEPAGDWGVANDEARGITVERIGLGEYRVTGSLGLALEGWRTQDPCSPDGGRMLGITDSHQDEDGTVTVRLFKQRWTLTDDGEMVPGRGAPIDVPLNSWIDVRLEMPKVETPPPTVTAEE